MTDNLNLVIIILLIILAVALLGLYWHRELIISQISIAPEFIGNGTSILFGDK